MVVASRCFHFRALTCKHEFEKDFDFKTRQVYFIYPFLRRLKIVTKKVCRFFFAQADILSEKSPYFGKHLFAKQELIARAKLRGQDFATGKNFSFNQYHTKSFAFSLEKVIL